MRQIKAKEAEKKEKGIIERIKDRFKYDIKKMETLASGYDIDSSVILNFDALVKAFVYYAVTQKTQGNKEIMGWLAGKREGNSVEIVDAYVGNCRSSSAYTQLDAEETVRMKKLARERGLVLCGQYHSHPGMSTEPSGEDTDTMKTLEKWGMEKPIMLIVNSTDFYLGTIINGSMKKVNFVMPPKTDNNLDINLGYINGEYRAPVFYSPYAAGCKSNYVTDKTLFAFYGMIGNYFLLGLDMFVPFLKLKKYVDWGP